MNLSTYVDFGGSLLAVVRGTVRLTIAVSLFVVAAVFVLVLYLVPVNIGGARLSMWPVIFLARALLPLFGLEVTAATAPAFANTVV